MKFTWLWKFVDQMLAHIYSSLRCVCVLLNKLKSRIKIRIQAVKMFFSAVMNINRGLSLLFRRGWNVYLLQSIQLATNPSISYDTCLKDFLWKCSVRILKYFSYYGYDPQNKNELIISSTHPWEVWMRW